MISPNQKYFSTTSEISINLVTVLQEISELSNKIKWYKVIMRLFSKFLIYIYTVELL